jgi:hypothetical protein
MQRLSLQERRVPDRADARTSITTEYGVCPRDLLSPLLTGRFRRSHTVESDFDTWGTSQDEREFEMVSF